MKKRHLLFTAMALALCPSLTSAKQVTNSLQKGEFLLYNVAAKQYICAGNNWGTRASLGEVGILLGIDPATDEEGNTISIISTKPYFDTDQDLRKDGFLDQGDKQQYVFKAVEGKENTYTISFTDGTEEKSLYYDPANPTLVSIGTPASAEDGEWQLVTIDPSDASKENPVDLSYLVRGADFNDRGNNRWKGDKPGYSHNNGDAADRCAEFYSKNYDMYQEITNLPNGVYKLSCYGFYRAGSTADALAAHNDGTEQLNAQLYGNSVSTPLQSIIDAAGKNGEVGSATDAGCVPNTMTDAEKYFAQGLYANNELTVTVTDGTLRVGIKKTTLIDKDWTIFDKVRLSYLGEDQSAMIAAAKTAYGEMIDKADEALGSEDMAVVTGVERTALADAVVVKPEETLEGYTSVTAAIKEALDAFTAAQPSYVRYKTEIDEMVATAQALGVANAETYRLTLDKTAEAAKLTEALNAIKVAQYKAADEGDYDESETDMALASWTLNDGDTFTFASATRQGWNGTNEELKEDATYYEVKDGWNDGPWTHGMQKAVELPAKKYVLAFACRTSDKAVGDITATLPDGSTVTATFPVKNDSGLGINTEGATSFDANDTFANTNGYGWEWRFLPFTLNEAGTVTFSLKLQANDVHQYPGLTNPKLAEKDGATGITEINKEGSQRHDDAVYNMAGQRVSPNNITTGIYIVNGKKIVKTEL